MACPEYSQHLRDSPATQQASFLIDRYSPRVYLWLEVCQYFDLRVAQNLILHSCLQCRVITEPKASTYITLIRYWSRVLRALRKVGIGQQFFVTSFLLFDR